MSNEALTAIAKSDIRPSGRKFVAVALADYADEAWSCFPSVEMIARYTAQGASTVRDHLAGLEDAGIIIRERERHADGTWGRYRYKIQRRNLPVVNFASGEKPSQPPPKSGALLTPKIEPPDTSSLRSDVARATKSTPRDELRSVLDVERTEAVIEHRQRIRKPMTAHAAKLLAGKFGQCPDPNAAADAMIANGWQGFEPAWLANRQRAGPAAPARAAPSQADVFRMIGEKLGNGQTTEDRGGAREAVSDLPAVRTG